MKREYSGDDISAIQRRVVDILRNHLVSGNTHYHTTVSIGSEVGVHPMDIPKLLETVSYRTNNPIPGRNLELFMTGEGKKPRKAHHSHHYRYAPCEPSQ